MQAVGKRYTYDSIYRQWIEDTDDDDNPKPYESPEKSLHDEAHDFPFNLSMTDPTPDAQGGVWEFVRGVQLTLDKTRDHLIENPPNAREELETWVLGAANTVKWRDEIQEESE